MLTKTAAIALAFACCASAPAPREAATDVDRLIAFSAADLTGHAPAPVEDFRNVRLTTLRQRDGVSRIAFCGEVALHFPGRPKDWAKFASLQTSDGYEQWLGGTSRAYCNEETKLDMTRDYSAALKDLLPKVN